MKIGEFAEKHNITQDTVRHYIELGLLATEKKGAHFDFSDVDSHDLLQTMELKKLNFSLNEALKILTIQRISGSNTHTFRNLYLNFLEDKKKEIEEKLLEYNRYNELIKEKIEEISSTKTVDKKKLGFPLASLQLLVCPKCHSPLKLSEGTIEENNVMDANLKCSCGYDAVISKGIFINKGSVRTKMINGEKMLTKEEYLACSSYEYNRFLYKGMNSLIEFIKKYSSEPEYILEMDNCVGFFLLQYIKYLPKNSVYILVDYDIERISRLKLDLEKYYEHKNFIFLCCDFENLPLKKSSMDVLIDYNMSRTYEEECQKELYKKVLPTLKANGIITGLYNFLGTNSCNLASEKANNYYNKHFYLKKFNKYNLKVLGSTDVGPIEGESIFNSEIKGAELYQSIYACKKVLG